MKSPGKRLSAILAVGALLAISAAFYTRYFLGRPIGSGPAGPDVDPTAFSSVWTDRPVSLVGIGDSVTAGLGAASPDHTFFNRLTKNPEDEYADMQGVSLSSVLSNLQAENLAVSGSTSADDLSVIDERLSVRDSDAFGLVVMTTGGNDLIHSYGRSPPRECAMYGATLEQAQPWIEAFGKRLDEMFSKIEDRFPGGCEIFVGDIYDPTDGVGDAPSVYLPRWPDGLLILAAYNRIIHETARARPNVHVVPLHQTFLGHGSHCRQFWRETYVPRDPHYWFYINIEDPNDRGYDAIRRTFLNAILEHSQLLPGRSGVPVGPSRK